MGQHYFKPAVRYPDGKRIKIVDGESSTWRMVWVNHSDRSLLLQQTESTNVQGKGWYVKSPCKFPIQVQAQDSVVLVFQFDGAEVGLLSSVRYFSLEIEFS